VVTSKTDRGGRTVTSTIWYAVGVGRSETVLAADGSETTYPLQSFTPGKWQASRVGLSQPEESLPGAAALVNDAAPP
jgi:hypothetical protein